MSEQSVQLVDGVPESLVPGLGLLLLVFWVLWLALREPRRAFRPTPVPAVAWLTRVAAVARETGRSLVMPIGRANIAGTQALDSEAALVLAQSAYSVGGEPADLAAEGAQPADQCIIVAGDPTLWLAGYWHDRRVCFVGPDASTYASGVRSIVLDAPNMTVAPYGVFGDDFLVFAEPASWEGQTRAPAAVTTSTVLPFLLATYEQTALGAELYEAAALASEDQGNRTWLSLHWLHLVLALVILLAGLVSLLQPT